MIFACIGILKFQIPVEAPMGLPKYPLKISDNGRYLVDQNGDPFLLQGDAPWSLFVGLSREDVDFYLKNRSQKGFNTLLVNLIERKFCRDPPKNFFGEAPFKTPGDFTTPNEAYFQHADWVIRKAADYGIQILLCPNFLGVKNTDHGWWEEIAAQSLDQCLEYGAFLGKRYESFDNILWSMGCDHNPDQPLLERMNATSLGVKEHDCRHLMTAQTYPESSSVEIFSSGGWLDVNAAYSYAIVHRKLLLEYNRLPRMPTFLIESSYEGEHNSTTAQIRRQAYWSVLCGGFGHVFGNFAIWPFGVEFGNGADWPRSEERWQAELDKPGSVSMMHFGNFFRSRRWFDLIPDQKHDVVTGGLGEFRGLDYLSAAVSSDGRSVVSFLPTARTVSIDLSKLKVDRVKAMWYDPRDGKTIPAGEFPNSGTTDFTPPSPGDWVLAVEDAKLN
jgi:hypothetical protein